MKNLDNTINYIEFPARDLDRTKDFYTRAFGWKFVDYGPNYASFEGAGIDGGFTQDSNPSTSSGVLVVLYNAKLEETETRIRALGGEIVRPIFTFPGGRRFHFTDPSGNEVAIWSE